MNDFFIRPAPPNSVIHVILDNDTGKIDETARSENWAEVYVGATEVGQLDAVLTFKPSSGRASNGSLVMGPLIRFALVLTDKHWNLEPDGAVGKELKGPPEWRIDCTENTRWITVDTALAYVTEARDKSTRPSVKKNAEITIQALKKLKK